MKKSFWKHTTLGDVCLKITDGSHWSPKAVEQGVPMASVKDMTDYGFNINTCKLISEKDYKKLIRNDCKPLKEDVLIAKDGSYLKHAFVWKEKVDLAILSSIAILRPNKDVIDPLFLAKYLLSPTIKAGLTGYVSGAALPRIILKDFINFKIIIPPLPTQHKIASILSTYDDLIENNIQRIRILEKIAQMIYREWFVHFRFPGHEKVRMVDSPLGKIPEGWEVKRLEELAYLVMGQSPKSEFYNEEGNGLPFHQGVKDFGHRFPTNRVYCTIENRIAEKGDILFSVRAPVGRMNITHEKVVIGRGLSAIRSKNGYQCILFQQLKEKFKEEDAMGGGTIFKAVTKKDMQDIQLVKAPEETVDELEELLIPIFRHLEIMTSKNKYLRQSRDLILPKLISGEIDVEQLDTEV